MDGHPRNHRKSRKCQSGQYYVLYIKKYEFMRTCCPQDLFRSNGKCPFFVVFLVVRSVRLLTPIRIINQLRWLFVAPLNHRSTRPEGDSLKLVDKGQVKEECHGSKRNNKREKEENTEIITDDAPAF